MLTRDSYFGNQGRTCLPFGLCRFRRSKMQGRRAGGLLANAPWDTDLLDSLDGDSGAESAIGGQAEVLRPLSAPDPVWVHFDDRRA